MNEKTTYDLEYYVNIAKQAFDSQTGDELAEIKKHFGKAYDEAKVVALITVKMLARIVGLQEDGNGTRTITPLDRVVHRAMKRL